MTYKSLCLAKWQKVWKQRQTDTASAPLIWKLKGVDKMKVFVSPRFYSRLLKGEINRIDGMPKQSKEFSIELLVKEEVVHTLYEDGGLDFFYITKNDVRTL